MAWETARRKEKHVDPLIVTRADETRSNAFRRSYHAPEPPCIYRKVQVQRICPPLHFYEGDGFSTSSDEIDFATWRLHPLGKDAPSLEPQVPRSQRLSAPAEALPLGAAHLSSMARA